MKGIALRSDFGAAELWAKARASRNGAQTRRLLATKKPKARVDGQREMLLPITGGAGEPAREPTATPAARKAS